MKRFLITTALEETWTDDQPVLFLGEWCRLYSRKERWLGMNAKVLPYHWDKRHKLYEDYKYLKVFYERALNDLSNQLNQIHGIDYSRRYWRIFIGPWLAYFIHILFDRWVCIQEAISSYEINGTTILTGNENDLVPNDIADLCNQLSGDEWNQYIYASILNTYNSISKNQIIYKNKVTNIRKSTNLTYDIFNKITSYYANITKQFIKDHDIFLIGTYLPFLKEIILSAHIGQMPQFWSYVKPVQVTVEGEKRKWKINDSGQNEFEKFVLAMIPKQIPTLYIEGYKQLVEQTQQLSWPKCPKAIFTSNALWHNILPMAYIAEKVERGTPLIYGQHGGYYGQALFTWSEEHERKISEKYLTWGWKDKLTEGSAETIPVGIIVKTIKRKKVLKNDQRDLLLILASDSRYTSLLHSASGTNIIYKYISDCLKFGTALIGSDAYKSLLVRMYTHEYGWGEREQWNDIHPNVRVNLGVKSIWNLVKKSKLVVYTYNSTGYLQFIASNIPTVVFWDNNTAPVRKSAIEYLANLKRVGIFHDTPESAANHVATIWTDVEGWWNSSKVQKVLEVFKKEYCNKSTNVVKCIQTVLNNEISKS